MDAADYERALDATRNSDTANLLRGLHHSGNLDSPLHDQTVDRTHRGVVADYLEERGREVEANLLRSSHPLRIHFPTTFGHYHDAELYPDYPTQTRMGETLVYTDDDDRHFICPDCANLLTEEDPHGTPVFRNFIHDFGPTLTCTNCRSSMPSDEGDEWDHEGE